MTVVADCVARINFLVESVMCSVDIPSDLLHTILLTVSRPHSLMQLSRSFRDMLRPMVVDSILDSQEFLCDYNVLWRLTCKVSSNTIVIFNKPSKMSTYVDGKLAYSKTHLTQENMLEYALFTKSLSISHVQDSYSLCEKLRNCPKSLRTDLLSKNMQREAECNPHFVPNPISYYSMILPAITWSCDSGMDVYNAMRQALKILRDNSRELSGSEVLSLFEHVASDHVMMLLLYFHDHTVFPVVINKLKELFTHKVFKRSNDKLKTFVSTAIEM